MSVTEANPILQICELQKMMMMWMLLMMIAVVLIVVVVVVAESVESLLRFCWHVVLKSSSHSMAPKLKESPLNKQLKAANEGSG